MTAEPPGGARRPVRVARLVVVLGLLEAFGPLSMDLYLPQLPQLARTLGTTDALAQATMAVCLVGLGIGQLIAGPLSDRYGRKIPLIAGIALFTLFSAVCAAAPSVEVLLAARFLQGLAGAAGVVISMAIARDLFHGVELSRVLSLLALITSLAPIAAPIAGGQLARIMDWRGIFAVLTGIGLALLALAALGLRETHREARQGDGERADAGILRTTAAHIAVLLRDPLFLALLTAIGLGGAAFFTYLSMSSFVLQGEFGLSPQAFSLVFALNACAQLAGAQLSRVCVRRAGTTRMFLAGLAASAVAAVALAGAALMGTAPAAFIALLAIFLGAAGIATPNGTALALTRHGARAGTAAALLGTTMFTVGAVVAPTVSAIVGTSAATMAVAIATAALGAVGAGLVAVRRLSGRP